MKSQLLIPLMLAVLVFAGCKQKDNNTTDKGMATANDPRALIAGTDHKTWHATKETTSEGDKDKLTRDEKKESVTFYNNGNFTMSAPDETREGTWTYSNNNLSLQYTGANMTENFAVLELSDNTFRLRAGDGSEMTLKAD